MTISELQEVGTQYVFTCFVLRQDFPIFCGDGVNSFTNFRKKRQGAAMKTNTKKKESMFLHLFVLPLLLPGPLTPKGPKFAAKAELSFDGATTGSFVLRPHVHREKAE